MDVFFADCVGSLFSPCYDEATFVESLAVLNAVGGERVEDVERLREEAALSNAINPATQRSKWVAIDAGYEDALTDLFFTRKS